MNPWTAAAVGLGAGAFIGWLAFRSAERELGRDLLTGGEDLTREIQSGTALALAKVPIAIRHEVEVQAEKELRNIGLDAGDVREWAAMVRVAEGWLR